MIGLRLIRLLAATGQCANRTVDEVIVHDLVAPAAASIPRQLPFALSVRTGNLADPGAAEQLASLHADVIFHLASVVSGDAEVNFDRGWTMNTRASWGLAEALRQENEKSKGEYRPRIVFTSSIAVFGPPFPDAIGDDFLCAPQTSYGAQKAMIELLLADYSRKGFFDAISLRLPTICVRPGKPNLAASSFFSGIIREPLNGQAAILPVADTVRHWHCSPRSAAGFLVHAAGLDEQAFEARRWLNMPGVSCTVAEQIEALRTVAGDGVVALIRREPDSRIAAIVDGWPRNFNASRARALGFAAERSFAEIIKVYIDEDLIK